MNPQYTTDPLPDNVTVPFTDPTLIVAPTPTLPTILPSPFISAAELSSHIYDVVATAIADGNTALMPEAIKAATQEAMGYMSRYDYVTILSQTGTARDPILLQYIKDMSVWHFIVLANPNIDYEVRESRYKFAIRWLEKIQNGKFIPAGWPIATAAETSILFHIRSNRKRSNNY